jgi:hypothetical protein
MLLVFFFLARLLRRCRAFFCKGSSMYAIDAACVLSDVDLVDFANTCTHGGMIELTDTETDLDKFSLSLTCSTRPWQLSSSLGNSQNYSYQLHFVL